MNIEIITPEALTALLKEKHAVMNELSAATITFSGLFCPHCFCSASFLPTPAGESAVICNNPRCGKTAMLSVAHECFITQAELVARRAGPEVDIPDEEPPITPDGGGPPRWTSRFRGQPRAFTAVSIGVEARIATCPNCRGIHHVQDCPELRQALLSRPEPRASVDLGRELCWLKWANHPLFIALLCALSTKRMAYYAESYIAFVRTIRPDTDLTAGQVLTTWLRLIAEHEDDGPPPAAPAVALRWAA